MSAMKKLDTNILINNISPRFFEMKNKKQKLKHSKESTIKLKVEGPKNRMMDKDHSFMFFS